MSNANLLNNARTTLKNCKLSVDDRNALIKGATAPLTAEELTGMLRPTCTAVDVAVSYYTKHKTAYEKIGLKIGNIAIGLNQFIVNYRDERDDNIEMVKTIVLNNKGIDLTDPKTINDAIVNELGNVPDEEKTTLFNWTINYFIDLVKTIEFKQDDKKEDEVKNEETNEVEAVVVTAATPTAEAETPNPTATEETAPAEPKEPVEKEYVQWTREACAEAHAEGIAKGEDAIKAAKRAALMGKLTGGFLESLDNAKANDTKWETGVAGYEKRQESEKKDYVSKGLAYTNPEPLLTKLDIHIVSPVVNKLLSWF